MFLYRDIVVILLAYSKSLPHMVIYIHLFLLICQEEVIFKLYKDFFLNIAIFMVIVKLPTLLLLEPQNYSLIHILIYLIFLRKNILILLIETQY